MPKTNPLPKVPDISHVKVVTINDNEEVRVSADAQIRFALYDTMPINDTVLKCTGCLLATVHMMQLVTVADSLGEFDNENKRIRACTNCGKVSTN